MKKAELLEKMHVLLDKKGMRKIETFSGAIGANDNKATLEDVISCLECSDAEMSDYLTVFKLVYPASYNAIMNAGNWLTHSHNRYYVYCTARAILEN